jgi:hypothetical protein
MALAALCGGPCAALAQTPPPPACDAPEYRQFDFWLGEWEVTTPDGKVAGRNSITRIAGGCALHENWAGRGGFTGQSLSGWNKQRAQWQQTWLDSSGGRLDLAGAAQGPRMVMTATETSADKPGSTTMHRITWSPNADGSVRQHWESSEDGGRTWSTAFDGRYVRR